MIIIIIMKHSVMTFKTSNYILLCYQFNKFNAVVITAYYNYFYTKVQVS